MVRRGEVWIADLDPVVGSEMAKKRPAVIIQNDVGNRLSRITVVAPITSRQVDRTYPFEAITTVEDKGVIPGSRVTLNHIRSLDKRRLHKKIGQISMDTMEKVDQAIKVTLDI